MFVFECRPVGEGLPDLFDCSGFIDRTLEEAIWTIFGCEGFH